MVVWRRAAALAAALAATVTACLLDIDGGHLREIDAGPVPVPVDAGPDTSLPDGGSGDGGPMSCAVTKPFGPLALLKSLNQSPMTSDGHLRLTADELTGFFQSNRMGTVGLHDLFTATRTAPTDSFGAATNLSTLNTTFEERDPSPGPDGRTLYFGFGFFGKSKVMVATRAALGDPFGAPIEVAALKSLAVDFAPYDVGPVGLLLSSTRAAIDAGTSNILLAARLDGGGLAAPAPYAGMASPSDDRYGVMSSDGRVLYFGSSRAGGQGKADIWLTTRQINGWSAPSIVTELNSVSDDFPDYVSADRCRLYVTSDRTGSNRIYVATRTP